MTINGNPNPDFGPNRPTAAHRVIILDYYDGATEGLVQFRPNGMVYRFNLEGDVSARLRSWKVAPISADAIENFVRAAVRLGLPTWPVWHPGWKGANQETLRDTDAILNSAGEAGWTVTSSDPVQFSNYSCCQRPSHVAL